MEPPGTATLDLTLAPPGRYHLEWGVVFVALSPIEMHAEQGRTELKSLPGDLLAFLFVRSGKRLTLHNVPAGKIHVKATPSDPGPMGFSKSTEVDIKAGSENSVVLQLQPKGSAAGNNVTYEETFRDLYDTIGAQYPCFELKGIDWQAVGEELLPEARAVKSDEEFGLLCMALLARLEDSHAQLLSERAQVPAPPLPRWDPGFACLEDDGRNPVVYYVDRGGPAEAAGVDPGMTVLSVNSRPAASVIAQTMELTGKYIGYSSERYLRYHAHRFFLRQTEKGSIVQLEMKDVSGRVRTLELPASLGPRYLPRLPVPIDGIRDSAGVSWKMLDKQIGYIYVRRIPRELISSLDEAVGQLKNARGLIIDVRGNSGGGFDARRSHLNFAVDRDEVEPDRPRFKGPIALLIDARCISAGEGWASWFVATKRARLFGEATAGASARKKTHLLGNGLFKARFPVKAYRGYLDRPIERRGLEPDVVVRQSAEDLAKLRDTVLEAAKNSLLTRAVEAP